MRLLLGSGGFRTEERRAALAAATAEHFAGCTNVVFVPWALADHDGYVSAMNDSSLSGDVALAGLHEAADPAAAIAEADGIYVGGGNTFRLIRALHETGVMETIRNRVRVDGVPYMGVSAGSNAACPTLMTTNDMPITAPPSFEALGLVPFQINPHYFEGHVLVADGDGHAEHFGETRDERIAQFHEENDLPVVGLWEAGFLHVTDGAIGLTGAPARIFRAGQASLDITPPASLTDLLG